MWLMISIDDLRLIVALAASNTMAATARALNVTPPAVTRRLQMIEKRLGLHLVDRSGRRMVMTSAAEHLVTGARRIIEELGELTESLSTQRTVVSGHLRIVAPLGFGRRFVAPEVARFHATHPEVTIRLTLSDRPARLEDDACDLIIYVGKLRNSTLIKKDLAPNERFLCAAPEYLARNGTPRKPEDLLKHDCIALRENDEDVTMWRFASENSRKQVQVRIEPSLSSNDGEVVRAWALAGAGIIMRSEWDVADDIHAGRLVRVLVGWRLPPAHIVALLSTRSGRSARTAEFLKHLQAVLTPAPWRQSTRRAVEKS
jgi:DNA-binding transcriptional LysR family regulator